MYTPPAFRIDDRQRLVATIRDAGLATLVTATAEGLMATPLPLLLDETEGPHGTLYGHLARANPQGRLPAIGGEALAMFTGPDAYVTPAFYATKQETGRVVPTWNYVAVHAYGPLEVFDDPRRLLEVVRRLTERHEAGREVPWSVADAPQDFIRAQLRGIVGLRLQISRIEGKCKASQNRPAADRDGVAAGLAASDRPADREMAAQVAAARP